MYYYVYVLRSEKDKKFYIGCTGDLKLRFEAHQKGSVHSTVDRRPFELVYYEACKDNKDARHRENYLKTTYGHRFIKNRLKSYFTG
ncbi:MAG: excinuclease ABC subunit C [Candidatus Taylorbacteria bacterium RIFCSPLOWO2_12_FULL_43_20]|uniref:Excinuclease ABC subunit C n=1 Tax=Candidatus Taylorbacteria bacterium RIFCSPLOWO2_12_FULL_43_20 TaxID=1802332 RepID=A0A1G2NZD8_9BACT|nr:MAG: excinuclease ABC subunit C [Candidatus Taylorbacteria bacterium RIFCSPHIGHO2_01_FULL_43_120]OHA22188.1 MAG: excinuclease ABC subunit C [Candidatus Taylorbacteria bacterium RIFCSPHIGHO2_02_FULL_43_55]OHA28038.1 MAG: excinuclease ABC subunit C [Candidatus Taylorbacteria bacterium RIFCSPHIGHO2_12_FULL_42_34]OHA32271.1 MAG: excinuclease ABC subunit C [Candidatus Taylorbacteria bacterium RIFCSPLOWO2_01_FULL_43_83]OHA37864.1 MAG: excinuclease ABC subunit C [Candidatus Taylorbacteria bacterium